MDLSNFLVMRQEVGLLAVFMILFLIDLFAPTKFRPYYNLTACIIFAAFTAFSFMPVPEGLAFGGMYITTSMTVFMKGILSLGTLIIFLQSHKWLKQPEAEKLKGEFYTLTLVTLLGMFFMVSSGNFMMMFIGIETASLPLACLAAFNKNREKSAEAGAKYILITAFSSAVMMFGLSMLYGAIGSLYFEDMAGVVANPMTIVGLVFFFAGMGFKISLVPFHLWTADVYEGAPTSVTAYFSVVSKGAAAFALLFALFNVFGSMQDLWKPILWWIVVITITIGNLFAIRQKDFKRFFAFSSISQAGFILLGVITGTPEGLTSVVYFVLVYLFSNLAIFGVLASLERNSENVTMSAINGLYKTNPLLSFVMMLAVFSLGGIPPLAGFFSKFFIFAAAAEQGQYVLVFIALVNTVISLYYYLLIIRAMFIEKQGDQTITYTRTDSYNKISLVICVGGVLIVGFASVIFQYIGDISF